MASNTAKDAKWVPTYCFNCVAGPDLLTVKVENGVATEIGPNFSGKGIHPGDGKPCVKAYGLIQKTYSPHRVLSPMRRTNPKKGKNEDPGFEPISWDEALDIVAKKLLEIRAKGVLDEDGLPRVAASFGHGGTPSNYMGTFPAFLSAWGQIDYSFGSGQGVKCTHSEHLYGEYWHRAFTVAADTPNCEYIISFGANVEVTGGVCSATRQAAARARGLKRVYVEPHLGVTAAASAEWVPIKPKTDGAMMFALIHVMIHERLADLDLPFLRDRSASPYLVGPNGYYLRDPASGKPLMWDTKRNAAVPFDTPDTFPALEGRYSVPEAYEQGPDKDRWQHHDVEGVPSFTKLLEHMKPYSPEWAETVCDVPAERIRRIANEFVDHAHIGETVEVDGQILPFRPVAVTLGKTVNNGWGAFDCCWSRTLMAVLVGGLEVPGGTLGTTVRINRPHEDRMQSVKPGEDGFMVHGLNPTDPERWVRRPANRNAHRTLVPLSGNGPWSQALGPTHLAWMWQKEAPKNLMNPAFPELWFTFRTNPAIAFWDTHALIETIARFPFMVSFAYTVDETNWMADILLPEATDLESMQLIRLGRTKYIEQFWDHQGYVLRQPVVDPRGDTRDFTWISTELSRRVGLLREYNTAINRGAGTIKLRGEGFDYSLDVDKENTVEEIWDHACKAASAEVSGGTEIHDLAWYKENGFFSKPWPRLNWYLYPKMIEHNLRYELPYQERLTRSGRELERRLHEQNIHWWDTQLKEYEFLPAWHDIPGKWERALINQGAKPEDFPFWLITTKSMQFHAGGNTSIQLMDEVSQNIRGHRGVVMNTRTAETLGIEDGDEVEVISTVRSTRGPAIVNQGIRPDTLLIIGQFDFWATPYAKDIKAPSLNTVAPMSLELTDATGSGADVVRVSLRKAA